MPSPTQISKHLSYILRHAPQSVGITLDESGWVSVDELLAALASTKHRITRDRLNHAVATNTKKRFEFSPDASRIRARQGHSIPIDLALEPQTPPDTLFHGTPLTNLDSILATGIDKRARHAVHMSTNKQTMLEAAARRGKPTLIAIDAKRMHTDGHTFYKTENEVWLTDHVPPHYCTHAPQP